MADPIVFKNARVEWTTSTASSTGWATIPGVKSVEIPLTKAELANSVMGDNAETMFPGLLSAPVNVTLRQDFESGGVDAQVWQRFNDETKFQLRVAPVAGVAISGTNPAYRFTAVRIFGHSPLNGQHGQLLEAPIPFRLQSPGGVARDTAS